MSVRVNEYDVFLSYNRRDASAVELLATRLTEEVGLRVWMDRYRLRPGFTWRGEIETAMNASASALIVWGPQGLGPVQRQERDLSYALRDTHQDFQVIYCLLPDSPPPQGSFANIDTWVQFVGGLDEPDAFARLVAAIKGEAPPFSATSDLPDNPAPYRGLAAFGSDDARFFFGRSEYAEEILERLSHYPFVALLGASGSGKTSLVQAGLRPLLKSDVSAGVAWEWLLFNPGPQPLRSLARALTKLSSQGDQLTLTDTILQRLLDNQNQLGEIIQSFLPEGAKLMLVIDRLEEIFTLCEAEDERQTFLEILVALLRFPHQPTRVVATMRADFYSHVGRYPILGNELVNHQVYLMPMAQQNVAEIIGAPATQVGAIFEKGLAKRVEDDANEGGEIVLPLLQQTLDLLWRKRRGRWLTWDAYEEIGGVAGALRYHAGRVIESLNAEEQKIARRLFMRLIWLDEQTGTMAGRRVEKAVLIEESASRSDERVLQRLADERLVILRGQAELATVSLVHDTLPLHWEQLRQWMQEDREFLLWRQRLRSALTEWIRAKSDEGALMRGTFLDAAADWLVARPDDLNPDEEKFIGESLALRKRERLSRETRQRRIIMGLGAGFLIAVSLTIVAVVQRGRARHASQEALSSKLTALATLYSADRLDLALLLSSEAQRAGSTEDVRRTFLSLLINSPHLETFLHGHSGWVSGVAFSPNAKILASCSDDMTIILWDVRTRKLIGPRLVGHSDEVLSVAFSPDGKTLASGSKDGTIILWDVEGHRQLGAPLISHAADVRGSVLSVAFSPDGKLLASGTEDNTIVLWDLAARKPIEPRISEQESAVSSVAFSPDGKTLAAGIGGDITLWDVASQSTRGTLDTKSSVNSVAFSPDGQTLSVGSADKLVTLWDVATRTQQKSLSGHSNEVQSVAFSPDGKILASGSIDNTVILWNVVSGEQLDPPYRVHGDGVMSVAFSPDGRTLASGSRDNGVALWNVGEHHHVLAGHSDVVWAVAFGPDGKMLASSSGSSVILWNVKNITPQHLDGHSDTVTSLTFSPDGKTLVSSSWDRRIILWGLERAKPQPFALDCEKPVYGLAISPDGKLIVAGLDDGELIFWDAVSRQRIDSLKGPHGPWTITFSPDGKTLASGSDNGTITLWDVTTRKPIDAPLSGHKDKILSVAFSPPDGKILASSSSDKSIVLWDVDNQVPLSIPLTGHTDKVLAVAFSPDGKTLASSGNDKTIILWDVASRRPIGRPLIRHKGPVKSLAFSPDGRALASGSEDKTVVLWDINLDFDANRGCRIANRNLSQAEWNQFIGTDTPYECTCPDLPQGEGAPPCQR